MMIVSAIQNLSVMLLIYLVTLPGSDAGCNSGVTSDGRAYETICNGVAPFCAKKRACPAGWMFWYSDKYCDGAKCATGWKSCCYRYTTPSRSIATTEVYKNGQNVVPNNRFPFYARTQLIEPSKILPELRLAWYKFAPHSSKWELNSLPRLGRMHAVVGLEDWVTAIKLSGKHLIDATIKCLQDRTKAPDQDECLMDWLSASSHDAEDHRG